MKDISHLGLSLTIKFFLFTAIIVLLLVVVTLWFSSRKATALAHETIQAGLKETISAFDTSQQDRYTKLKLTNSMIAQNPYIQAYIAAGDSVSILDQARQRESEVKSDFIIVTDPEGTILARTDRPGASGQSVAKVPLVQEALEGEEAVGFWLENEELFNAVALPVVTGDTIIACLIVGYAINDGVANEIKRLTHSETAFVLNRGNQPVVIASTFGGSKEDLSNTFKNAQGRSGEPFQFELGPETYTGAIRELKDANGQTLGNFLAFRSLDRELYGFRQFQKNVLYVGLAIMLIAFIISYAGAKRITEPLRHLTNVVNEVKEGNYDVPIEVHSKDEVGILAESFRKLLGELKEKAQLVQYLSSHPGAQQTLATASTMQYGSDLDASRAVSGAITAIVPGAVIANRYEVQSVLGTGGMGVVLKARDRQLDEVVALKMLKGEVFTQDPVALERFKQELKLARRITHRHVVRTYDYSELDNYYMISMEYVKGITLKQLIRQRGSLPLKIGLQIGKQICAALDAAHEQGVVHRDIKPQNVLLESSGDVKIMDFGIARVADMKGMTSTGTVMGTPDYMSPEQAQGLSIDHRTDIYSTGVVLYEVFCGDLPFTGDSALVVLNKHIREQPPRPSMVNPNIPDKLEKILLKAMAKNPDQRYQSVSDLYKDLDDLSGTMPMTLEKTA